MSAAPLEGKADNLPAASAANSRVSSRREREGGVGVSASAPPAALLRTFARTLRYEIGMLLARHEHRPGALRAVVIK